MTAFGWERWGAGVDIAWSGGGVATIQIVAAPLSDRVVFALALGRSRPGAVVVAAALKCSYVQALVRTVGTFTSFPFLFQIIPAFPAFPWHCRGCVGPGVM